MGREFGIELGERGVDDPAVGLREEDGDHPTVVGQLVSPGAGDASDEAFAPEAAQVIGGLADVIAGDQAGDELAQASVGHALEQVLPGAQAGEHGHHPWVAEPEAGGGLAVDGRRQHDRLQRGRVGRALTRRELMGHQPLVDLLAETGQLLPGLSARACV